MSRRVLDVLHVAFPDGIDPEEFGDALTLLRCIDRIEDRRLRRADEPVPYTPVLVAVDESAARAIERAVGPIAACGFPSAEVSGRPCIRPLGHPPPCDHSEDSPRWPGRKVPREAPPSSTLTLSERP